MTFEKFLDDGLVRMNGSLLLDEMKNWFVSYAQASDRSTLLKSSHSHAL